MNEPREPRHWVAMILAALVATVLAIGFAAGLMSLGIFPITIQNTAHHGAKAPSAAPAAKPAPTGR